MLLIGRGDATNRLRFLGCDRRHAGAVAVGAVMYWQFYQTLVHQELNALSVLARIKGVRFTAEMEALRADTLFLAHAPVVQRTVRAREAEGVDLVSHETDEQLRNRMANFFSELLRAKPAYHRVRLLGVDDGGREIVGVDRAAGCEFAPFVSSAVKTPLTISGSADSSRRAIRSLRAFSRSV